MVSNPKTIILWWGPLVTLSVGQALWLKRTSWRFASHRFREIAPTSCVAEPLRLAPGCASKSAGGPICGPTVPHVMSCNQSQPANFPLYVVGHLSQKWKNEHPKKDYESCTGDPQPYSHGHNPPQPPTTQHTSIAAWHLDDHPTY